MSANLLEMTARSVFHASWQAGVLAVVVFFVCRASARVPAAVRSLLWLVVAIRFLVPAPALPQSPASLFNVAKLATSETNTVAHVTEPRAVPGPATAFEPIAGSVAARDTAVLPAPGWDSRNATIAAGVWLLGFLIVSSRDVLSLFGLRRLLARCRPATDDDALALLHTCRDETGIRRQVALLVTDCDAAPALAGVVWPRIVVSQKTNESLGPDELRWLFRHELAHVRRWDLLIQRIWELACAVHWFNPLAWWGASRARLAAELACDESLLRQTAAADHASYGQALLNVAESLASARSVPGAVGLLVGEPALSGRIRAIAGYRPRSRLWTLCGLLLVVALALAGLTDALESRGSAQQPESPTLPKAVPSPTSAALAPNSQVKLKIDPKKLATTKGKMRILVLELDGRPVEGAEVFANVVHPGDGRWLITNHTYFTDAGGSAIVQLPPKVGITKIWASKRGNPGYPDLFACWFPGVHSDASVIPEEFTFQPPLTVIGGVVNGEDGKPIRGVTIDVSVSLRVGVQLGKPGQRPVFDNDSYWTSSVPGPIAAVTNSQGRWVMDNVPLGAQVVLKLSRPGYVGAEIWDGVQRPTSPPNEKQMAVPPPIGQMKAPPLLSDKDTIGMRALRHQTASFVMRPSK
jgi:beta-lactamase regulating signal transducer with metallopeptidase domain